jgi:DNA-binding MarR family transcriptional regulator
VLGEPCWDILLDLAHARFTCADISVTSACLASGVPATTALRCLTILEEHGLLTRSPSPKDRRSSVVRITDLGLDRLRLYHAECVAQP